MELITFKAIRVSNEIRFSKVWFDGRWVSLNFCHDKLLNSKLSYLDVKFSYTNSISCLLSKKELKSIINREINYLKIRNFFEEKIFEIQVFVR